jgi:hypothetical protein
MNKKGSEGAWIVAGVLILILIIGTSMWALPKYKIYRLNLSGQADLKEAEWTKKIMIEEARAKKDSATLLANAEVERAKGVAQANKIIAGSITEDYLKYLYIQGLQTNKMQTIYIPTNGLLPVFDINKGGK